MADIVKHTNAANHEVWMRCFSAVLAGLGGQVSTSEPPNRIEDCAKLADLALEEEIKRRKDEAGGGGRA